jgi:hypothetical protein
MLKYRKIFKISREMSNDCFAAIGENGEISLRYKLVLVLFGYFVFKSYLVVM